MRRQFPRHRGRNLAGVAVVAAALGSPAWGFEADVHYGLTRWLALRAGFDDSQAEAIAIGDQRVDAGLVETTQLNLEYACTGRFVDAARLAQDAHSPAGQRVPAAPAERAVEAGGPAARAALATVLSAARGKEGLMLGRFGRALHPLQDSWAHQGVPTTPAANGAPACDPMLASGAPSARGGPESHAADVTARWVDDTLAMARTTYDEMVRYGPIAGRPRRPAAWDSLVAPLQTFAAADTKTQKRAWFNARGVADTGFLEGISLPDGPDPGPLKWNGRRIPPLSGDASTQHDAAADVRTFFDAFLARWLGSERIETLVAEIGPAHPPRPGRPVAAVGELIARLKLWKLRDHGSAAALAHWPGALEAAQRASVDRMTRDPASLIAPSSVADAVLPVQPSTPEPMPMLPYIVRSLPPVGGAARTIAIARLRHAPYDTVGWIAERRDDRWVLVAMVGLVDP